MNKLHKITTAGLLAAIMLGGAASYRALAAPAAPVPSTLAVINIVKVFAGLNEKIDGDREIEDLGKQINADRRKKEDNVKALSDGLQHPAFRVDSQDYKNLQQQVLQAQMDLQVFLAVSEQRLLQMQKMKTETIYRSMNAAIKTYAEEHGIAIVFVIDDADMSEAKDTRELTSRIAMRKIVYAHPSYEITNQIIEKMNADFHPSK